ncbi:MAG TPA: hypothetical protein VI790_01550 [Candidatus Nanoarchaeia archaeon]|nr:hypothetical protein [Candidatus Nanoarchaeia archaeon]
MNNKCYVFTPLLVLLFIFITIVVVSIKQGLISSVNQLVIVDGFMDKSYYNHSKLIINEANSLKTLVYSNISDLSLIDTLNDSLGGLLISDDLLVPLSVPALFYHSGFVNVSYTACSVNVSVSYPLTGLLSAYNSLDLSFIQGCLNTKGCSSNRGLFSSILIECLNDYSAGGFGLFNSSIPLLVGSSISVDLVFSNSGITSIYPFSIGSFVFSC